MNSGRQEIVDLLTATMPAGVSVIEYQKNLDNISKKTVMVVQKEIASTSVRGIVTYAFDLYVMTPLLASGTSDDDLDLLVEDVLHALQGSAVPNNVTWSKATRATFEEKFPAYSIELNVLVKWD